MTAICAVSLTALVNSPLVAADAPFRVRHAPELNGEIRGDIHQMLPESRWVNSGAVIEGDWYVPGSPSVQINGQPDFEGVFPGTGEVQPTNYSIGINAGVVLGRLVTRTDPSYFPVAQSPQVPIGNRYVYINQPTDDPGDFATLRNLTLNSNVGEFAIPGGVYGDFTANSGSVFSLGSAGGSEATIYHFQRLTLNSGSQLRVLGPVRVFLRYATHLNGDMGQSGEPDWLELEVSEGDITLNSGVNFYGHVVAPANTVTVNGQSSFHGTVVSNRLTVNSGGLLVASGGSGTQDPNQPPVVSAGEDQQHVLDVDYTITLEGTVSDDGLPEGAMLQIGWTLLDGPGDAIFADSSDPITAVTFSMPGSYTLQLSADDSEFVVTDSVIHTITQLNRAPEFVSEPVTDIDEGADYHYAVMATDPDLSLGDTISLSATTLPFWADFTDFGGGEGLLQGEPQLADVGEHTVILTATDSNGLEAQQSFIITVHPINQPPVVSAGEDQQHVLDVDYTITLEGTVSDDGLPEGAMLQIGWTLLDGPGDAIFADNSDPATAVTFSVPGSYTLQLSADDSEFVVTDTVIHTIEQLNRPPVAFDGFASMFDGETIGIVLTASDPDQDLLSFEIMSEPQIGIYEIVNQTQNTMELSFTAPLGIYGEDTIDFRVSDGIQYSNVATINVTITPFARFRNYQTSEDFTSGTSVNLNTEIPDQLTGTESAVGLQYVWATIPGKGLAVRVDVESGQVLGHYRTAPQGVLTPHPRRLAIDAQGRAWIGNFRSGTVTVIAAPESNPNWVDRDLSGNLTTSGGLEDVLPWPGAASAEVSAAADELIVKYIHLPNGIRPLHLSFDNSGNLWVGGISGDWVLLDAQTGEVLKVEPSFGRGGFGGFIDEDNILWSGGDLLRWDLNQPREAFDMSDWLSVPDRVWGIDRSSNGHIWLSRDPSKVIWEYDPHGQLVDTHETGASYGQGLLVDSHDEIWLALSAHCSQHIARMRSDGTRVGFIQVSKGPGSIDVDGKGRIWVGTYRGLLHRINPYSGPMGMDGQGPVGELELTTANLGGPLGMYANFVGNRSFEEFSQGVWTVVFDSELTDAPWGPVQWDAILCNDNAINVEVAVSHNGQNFFNWKELSLSDPLPLGLGRYLQVRVSFAPGQSTPAPVLRSLTVGTNGYNPATLPVEFYVATGDDIFSQWPNPIRLHGKYNRSSHYDPDDLQLHWEKISGPGEVSFVDVNDPQTVATFTSEGVYTLRLHAQTSEFQAYDDLIVELEPFNKPPVANAGLLVFNPEVAETVILDGWVLDDGLPAGESLNIQWSKTSGPGDVIFDDPSNPQTNVEFTAPGLYILRLHADDGEFEDWDYLQVWVETHCILKDFPGLVAWWPGNRSSLDEISGNDAQLLGGTTYADAMVSQGFSFPGGDSGLLVFEHPSLDLAANDDYSIEFWMNTPSLPSAPVLEWNDGENLGLGLWLAGNGRLQVIYRSIDGISESFLTSINTIQANVPHHLVCTFSEERINLYVNGRLRHSWERPAWSAHTAADLYFGHRPGNNLRYTGTLDEISFYNRELSYLDVLETFHSGEIGKCPIDNNQPPQVEAGPDQFLADYQQPVILAGWADDDARPSNGYLKTQWEQIAGPDGVVFADAADPQTEVQLPAPGVYTFRLTAKDGGIMAVDTVQVRAGLLWDDDYSDGLAAWIPGDGYFHERVHGLAGATLGAMVYQQGVVGGAFELDGVSAGVRLPAAEPLNIAENGEEGSFSIELWLHPYIVSGEDVIVEWHDELNGKPGVQLVMNQFNSVRIRIYDSNGVLSTTTSSSDLLIPNEWNHIVVTYKHSTGRIRFHRNGTQYSQHLVTPRLPNTSTDLHIGYSTRANRYLSGLIDELSLYDRVIAEDEAFKLFATGGSGKNWSIGPTPLRVVAGPRQDIQAPQQTLILNGEIDTTSGSPDLESLAIQWHLLSGPGPVNFSNPNELVTDATFTDPGIYFIELVVSDNFSVARDVTWVHFDQPTCSVAVDESLIAWWSADFTYADVAGNHPVIPIFVGFADGRVGAAFDFDKSGHLRVPGHADLDLAESMDGFSIEFWARTESSGSYNFFRWLGGDAEDNGVRIVKGNNNQLTFNYRRRDGSVTNYQTGFHEWPMGEWVHFAWTWSPVEQILRYYRNGVLRQSYNTFGDLPDTRGDILIGTRAPNAGQAGQTSFSGQLDEISLYRRVLDSSEIGAIHATGSIGKCWPQPVFDPPSIALLTPMDGGVFGSTDTISFSFVADQSDFGIASVAIYRLDSAEEPQWLADAVFDSEANTWTAEILASAIPLNKLVSIFASATAGDGQSTVSDLINIFVFDESAPPPVATITAPSHTHEITAPTIISGTASSTILDFYAIDIRVAGENADWRTVISSNDPVDDDSLGTLDPTLLHNGIYQLRLRVTDLLGRTALDFVTVTVAGGMKVGHFQLAFEDLSLPLSGVPVQLIRSYDSRGGRGGDFGPDWDLGFRSVQVQVSGVVGALWEDYVVSIHPLTGIPTYGIRPIRRHVVSVLVGDEIQQFEAWSPTQQGVVTLQAAELAFRPINGSTGDLALTAIDSGLLPIVRDGGEVQLFDFSAAGLIDPQNWVYTTTDGVQLDIERVFGLRSMTDRHQNAITFTPLSVTHSNGESIEITRDTKGRVTAITDPDGEEITYQYDAAGWLSLVTNRAGETIGFDYINHPATPDGSRRLLHTITDPLGNPALAATFDDDGRLIGQSDAYGSSVSFDHDLPNRRQTITDRLGHSTLHEYDLRGNVVRTVDALGQETLREYDDQDNEILTIDALGNITERGYDADNNLLFETQYVDDGSGSPLALTTTYSYDSFGHPLTIADPAGNVTAFAYDTLGALTSMTDALNHSTTFSYDASGNLTEMVDPLGNRTTHSYDVRGQIITTTVYAPGSADPLRESAFTYDSRGNQTSQTEYRTLYDSTGAVTGLEARLTEYQYDSENRLIRTIFHHPDGGASQISETVYNAAGQEILRIDNLGLETEHVYDLTGNRVETNHPDGTRVEWSYDAEGRTLSEIHYDANGEVSQAIAYAYDAVGQRISVIHADQLDSEGYPEGPAELTFYDAIGRVVSTIDVLGNETFFEYDTACGCSNLRSRVIDALGNVTVFQYDANGNQTAVTDALGHTTWFEYDALNRPVKVIHADGNFTETAYDAAGRRTAETDELGRRTEFTYDPIGRLIQVDKRDESDELLTTASYAYDEAGNRIEQTDALGRTTRYQYDYRGNRTARIKPNSAFESFSYDPQGRLTAHTNFDGHTTTYSYDSLSRLIEERADASHPSLLLPHVAYRHTMEYDAAGRLAAKRVWSGPVGGNAQLFAEEYSYDLRGRVNEVTTPHGTLSYNYDPNGNLTSVSSNNANGVDLEYAYDVLNRLQIVKDHCYEPNYRIPKLPNCDRPIFLKIPVY